MFIPNIMTAGTAVTPYLTKQETICVDGVVFHVKSLLDRNQFYDPEGAAERLGISSALWPISGMLWPAGIVLARVVSRMAMNNLRVLEVGCGIGLASMVAASKKADITASDYHPITQQFLRENTALNDLDRIAYFHGNWHKPITRRGVFDLIIGSDLLYERGNLDILATFINCHLSKSGKVILIDPKRRHGGKFVKLMAAIQFDCRCEVMSLESGDESDRGFRCYTFTRKAMRGMAG